MDSGRPGAVLDVRMRHRLGGFVVEASFQLEEGWTILFGPSGSGKTTILRAIAGLTRPEDAVITVGRPGPASRSAGEVLQDTRTGVFVPPHRRDIPLVPQRAALLPHRDVLGNLLYGYPAIGSPQEQAQREQVVEELPALFRIEHLLRKYPRELSGGEAQRVSLARALMGRPRRLLLLDEPLTGLDASLRDSLIEGLLVWQQRSRVPILSVTHDVGEAFQLGAEVIRIAEGRVEARGPVAEVLWDERERLLRSLRRGE